MRILRRQCACTSVVLRSGSAKLVHQSISPVFECQPSVGSPGNSQERQSVACASSTCICSRCPRFAEDNLDNSCTNPRSGSRCLLSRRSSSGERAEGSAHWGIAPAFRFRASRISQSQSSSAIPLVPPARIAPSASVPHGVRPRPGAQETMFTESNSDRQWAIRPRDQVPAAYGPAAGDLRFPRSGKQG